MKKMKSLMLGLSLLFCGVAVASTPVENETVAPSTTIEHEVVVTEYFGMIEYAYYDAQSGEYMGSFFAESAGCANVCFVGVYVA